MSEFPYDDAIRQLKAHRDEAQREATSWGYYATNDAWKGPGYVQTCLGQRALQIYMRDVFEAAVEHTESKKQRAAQEAAMNQFLDGIAEHPLVEKVVTKV